MDQAVVQQPGLVGSTAQAANAKPKPKPKALAKVSAIASYVGMIQFGPRSSNSFSLQQAFHWDLWMCPLTVEQDQLWKDHPLALTVFIRVRERQHREVDSWFILREALI